METNPAEHFTSPKFLSPALSYAVVPFPYLPTELPRMGSCRQRPTELLKRVTMTFLPVHPREPRSHWQPFGEDAPWIAFRVEGRDVGGSSPGQRKVGVGEIVRNRSMIMHTLPGAPRRFLLQ